MDAAHFQDISTEAILAELAKRHGLGPSDNSQLSGQKPECKSAEAGSYDMPLHVFALFLILTLSTLACGFPLLSTRSFSRAKGSSRLQADIIFYCQHFGTGVLIATAFVHLLPTAFSSLTDPCLPDAFNRGYPPLAGLVAMVSALAVVAVEQWFATRGAGHRHAHGHEWHEIAGNDENEFEGGEEREEDEEARATNGSHGHSQQAGHGIGHSIRHGIGTTLGRGKRRSLRQRRDDITLDNIETRALVADISPLPGSTPLTAQPDRKPFPGGNNDNNGNSDDGAESDLSPDLDLDLGLDLDLDLDLEELSAPPPPSPPPPQVSDKLSRRLSSADHPHHSHGPSDGPSSSPSSAAEQRRLLVQCLLLEAGILFHSVFIGVALSVATGPAFVVFLVAISFHQSFEGLALGSRIAAIRFPRASARPWLMVLAYGATTPLGQAIGLAVHGLYDPRSVAGLLMVGFTNGLSAGLLLFAGFVQLLAEDFLTPESYRVLKGGRRRRAYGAVVAGASLMAVVGAFA